MNRRGVAPIVVVLVVLLALMVVYAVLLINPFGVFTLIKSEVNFWLSFTLYIAFTVLVIYLYFNIGVYVTKGIKVYRDKLLKFSPDMRKWIAN